MADTVLIHAATVNGVAIGRDAKSPAMNGQLADPIASLGALTLGLTDHESKDPDPADAGCAPLDPGRMPVDPCHSSLDPGHSPLDPGHAIIDPGHAIIDPGRASVDPALALVEPELHLKHPLENVWSLWYFKNDKKRTWAENLRNIATFNTVEDFWALYNSVVPASHLNIGCDYAVFKEGVRPMWEDEMNKRGGRWLLSLERNRRTLDLDQLWQDTLLCMVGESFDDLSDDVCGAVINIRAKADKLAVWTRDASNESATLKIGKKYKQGLGVDHPLEFEVHADTQVKTGSMAKRKHVI